MKLKKALSACICLGHLASIAAFTPEEARRVYGEASSPPSSSLEEGDYVFMEVRWSVAEGATAEEAEEGEMSAMMSAIESYVKPHAVVCTNSPFSRTLTSWMTPDFEFSVPNVQSVVVKENEKDGKVCKVIAFDAAVLKAAKADAAKKANSVNVRNDSEWLDQLKLAAENFKSAEEKRKFNVMMGCPIVNFILCSGKYEERNVNEDEKGGVDEVGKIVNWSPAKDSVFSEYPGLLWTTHKNGDSGLFYPGWREDDGGKFAEAESLYLKGKDVPRILTLLAESISANPIGEKKWQYLGGVLKALGKNDDAMIAYVQALKFNKDNVWAWKGVRDCCRLLDLKTNAAGLEWYFKLNGIK